MIGNEIPERSLVDKRPSGQYWVPICKKSEGKCDMDIWAVHTLPTYLSMIDHTPCLIASINTKNPNYRMDARLIMASAGLYEACRDLLEYVKNGQHQYFSLDSIVRFAEEKISMVETDFKKEFKETIKGDFKKFGGVCQFEDCPLYHRT